MDSVLRAVIVYLALLALFRLTGKRSLAQVTTFDFVLLLIVSETVQPALADRDDSMTNSLLLVTTLLAIDVGLSVVKRHFPRIERLMDDVPLVLVADGTPLRDRLEKARVDEDDILASARQLQGLQRMDQIAWAVLERSGGISIVPKETA